MNTSPPPNAKNVRAEYWKRKFKLLEKKYQRNRENFKTLNENIHLLENITENAVYGKNVFPWAISRFQIGLKYLMID